MAASIALSDPRATRIGGGYLIRLLVASGTMLVSVWLLGFGWFLYQASGDPSPTRHADAIVALTGGPNRVEVALRLLANGTADRLLVSGAGEKTDWAVLAHRAGIDQGSLERKITLGHAAHSTRGNALETASWVHEKGIGSLLVVTAWFHMPRALLELRRTMPTVIAESYPVGRLDAAELARDGMAWRLVGEYHKYLAALAGFTLSPFVLAARRTESAG